MVQTEWNELAAKLEYTPSYAQMFSVLQHLGDEDQTPIIQSWIDYFKFSTVTVDDFRKEVHDRFPSDEAEQLWPSMYRHLPYISGYD